MSIEAMSCAWHNSSHTGGELMVLLAVADNANDDMVCWPGQKYIARKCRISVRHVQRCIQALVKSGELIRLSVGDGRESSRYKINIAQLRTLVDEGGRHNVRGDTHVVAGATPCRGRDDTHVALIINKPSSNHQFVLSAEDEQSTKGGRAEKIYEAYPLHKARPEALKAINRRLKEIPFDVLLAKTKAFAEARGDDLEYCPQAATWFNQERYSDDPKTWVRSSDRGGKPKRKKIDWSKVTAENAF